MNKDEEIKFVVNDKNGNEVVCYAISLLDDIKKKQTYIIYTDLTINNKKQLNTYLSKLNVKDDNFSIDDIDSDEEFENVINNAKLVYGRDPKDLLGVSDEEI